MATAFTSGPGGTLRVGFESVERRVLATLAHDLAGMLADQAGIDPSGIGILEDARISDDPVLARLLPDAYADAEAATDFRRYTEQSLRSHKVAALDAMQASLHAESALLELDPAQAQAWLTGLNDLRLAIGTRMGLGVDVPEDESAEESLDEPDTVAALYDWLTWLQDGLIDALLHADDTLAP